MKETQPDKPRMIREVHPDFLNNFDKLAQAMREGNLDKAIEEVIPPEK